MPEPPRRGELPAEERHVPGRRGRWDRTGAGGTGAAPGLANRRPGPQPRGAQRQVTRDGGCEAPSPPVSARPWRAERSRRKTAAGSGGDRAFIGARRGYSLVPAEPSSERCVGPLSEEAAAGARRGPSSRRQRARKRPSRKA